MTEITDYECLSEDNIELLIKTCIRKGLPLDIFRFIYKSHFSKEVIYRKKYAILLQQVESPECQCLIADRLKIMIGTFINNPQFIAYVSGQNEIFERLYKAHYVNGVKIFRLVDTLESLAMSWLMTLYH